MYVHRFSRFSFNRRTKIEYIHIHIIMLSVARDRLELLSACINYTLSEAEGLTTCMYTEIGLCANKHSMS